MKQSEFVYQVPTERAFSFKFLCQHPTTAPIVERYFGRAGAEVFSHSGRNLSLEVLDEPQVQAFLEEINFIPVTSLLDENVSLRLTHLQDNRRAILQYFFDRPYFKLFTADGMAFLVNLLIGCHQQGTLQAKPSDWQDAMIYIRNRDGDISEEQVKRGQEALCLFRARYVLEKLSAKKIYELLNFCLDPNNLSPKLDRIYTLINIELGEEIESKFLKQKVPRIIDLDALKMQLEPQTKDKPSKFADYFRYPEEIEFTPEANSYILEQICQGKLSDTEIDFYLGLSSRAENYLELYPAIRHIMQTTQDAHAFWTAGDVLNLIWLNLPDEDDLQDWFCKEIYQIVWPRIGSAWTIRNWSHIKFGGEDQQTILNDSIGWVCSLGIKRIKKLNRELYDYLAELSQLDFTQHELTDALPESIRHEAFRLKHIKDSYEVTLRDAYRCFDEKEMDYWLGYHNDLAEVKDILKLFDYALQKILKPDSYLGDLPAQLYRAICNLMTHQEPNGAGKIILEWLTAHFSEIAYLFCQVPEPEIGFPIQFFEALCDCVYEYESFQAAEQLAEKFRGFIKEVAEATDQSAKKYLKQLDNALEKAEQNSDDYLQQEGELDYLRDLMEITEN